MKKIIMIAAFAAGILALNSSSSFALGGLINQQRSTLGVASAWGSPGRAVPAIGFQGAPAVSTPAVPPAPAAGSAGTPAVPATPPQYQLRHQAHHP